MPIVELLQIGDDAAAALPTDQLGEVRVFHRPIGRDKC